MRFFKPWVVALAVTGTICVGLMIWYEWGAKPLDRDEVDEYIEVIEAQTQIPGARHDHILLHVKIDQSLGKFNQLMTNAREVQTIFIDVLFIQQYCFSVHVVVESNFVGLNRAKRKTDQEGRNDNPEADTCHNNGVAVRHD